MLPDTSGLSMTEIIQLRERLAQELHLRFERNVALVFTDVVGSTAYFAQHGDDAGRALLQRHLDHLAELWPRTGGRVVDTAGDGAFSVFPTTEGAAVSLIELFAHVDEHNRRRETIHRLRIRCGLHFGPVLTDGTIVTGDAVNLCARITATANPDEIRLTRAAFLELSNDLRVLCHPIKPLEVKGVNRAVEAVVLEHHRRAMPAAVRIKETGEVFSLPDKETITFGRLREQDGVKANDILLTHPDRELALRISRWHFEIRNRAEGPRLRALTDLATDVDGRPVLKNQEVLLRSGSVVCVAGILHLTFIGERTMMGVRDRDQHAPTTQFKAVEPPT
jgi:class 3 adenylate cyclase